MTYIMFRFVAFSFWLILVQPYSGNQQVNGAVDDGDGSSNLVVDSGSIFVPGEDLQLV